MAGSKYTVAEIVSKGKDELAGWPEPSANGSVAVGLTAADFEAAKEHKLPLYTIDTKTGDLVSAGSLPFKPVPGSPDTDIIYKDMGHSMPGYSGVSFIDAAGQAQGFVVKTEELEVVLADMKAARLEALSSPKPSDELKLDDKGNASIRLTTADFKAVEGAKIEQYHLDPRTRSLKSSGNMVFSVDPSSPDVAVTIENSWQQGFSTLTISNPGGEPQYVTVKTEDIKVILGKMNDARLDNAPLQPTLKDHTGASLNNQVHQPVPQPLPSSGGTVAVKPGGVGEPDRVVYATNGKALWADIKDYFSSVADGSIFDTKPPEPKVVPEYGMSTMSISA